MKNIRNPEDRRLPVLTIAGSDPSGGAGIQADLKTILVHGLYGMSVITALTAQNTLGIINIMPVSADFLKQQLDCIFTDIFPEAVKIGMLGNQEIALTVAEVLEQYRPSHIVIDTVLASTSKTSLLEDCDLNLLKTRLFPMAELLTPNLLELTALTGLKINTRDDFFNAVKALSEECRCPVLGKGGHFTDTADDLLYNEGEFHWYAAKRINNPNTHGTGCTLSSAIASNLALGMPLWDAVGKAKEYVREIMSADLNLGKGIGPMDHGAVLKK